MRLTRVTLDWDFKKLRAIYNLIKIIFQRKFNFYSIELRKSPSNKKNKGKGFHVIIWYYGKVPKFKLRKKFHDDKNRIRIDRFHRKNKQFLFTKKRRIKILK